MGLQRQVDRVAVDNALLTYLHGLVNVKRTSPVLSLGASTRGAMSLGKAAPRPDGRERASETLVLS